MSFASKMKSLANKVRQAVKDAEKENRPLTYKEWRSKFHFEIETAKSHLEEQLILSAERGEYRTIFDLPHNDTLQIGFYRVAAKELGCSMVKRPNILGQYSISFATAQEEPKEKKIIIPPYDEVIPPQEKVYVSPAMDRDYSDDDDNEIKPVSEGKSWNELGELWRACVEIEDLDKPATPQNKIDHPVF